ncbi:hypothetical protein D9Q98_003726 [Chlorella vulgaris]|uniref:MYND-type domain-containing protein n=1 Tax=Chlorella vulgaris TaxID=3077 RepID=A0A9D4YZ87_CHLVU|nr:hypothetical protein D9Q98_003726 [Chlorella vulgaris]
MAASAAGLVKSLVADVCDLRESTGTLTQGLSSRITRLPAELKRSLACWPGPEAVAALDRAIQAGARQLSALGTRLAAIIRSGDRALLTLLRVQLQLCTACQLAETMLSFTTETGMCGAAQALFGCVTLPLECGRALMAVPDASDEEDGSASLDSQAMFVFLLVTSADNAAAAQLASPEPLLAWLSAAASRVGVVGTLLGRDTARKLQAKLVYILFHIMSDVPFTPHLAALELDVSLQRSLVPMLMPPLHEAAAAMQLPADRRPAELSWVLVLSLTYALRSEPLTSRFLEHQAVESRGDSSFAPRMLQTAAQLFAMAPASRPDNSMDDNAFANLWAGLLSLLSMACSTRMFSQQRQVVAALPAASRQRLARQMLQALRRLPTALRVAADFSRAHTDTKPAARSMLHLVCNCLYKFDLLADRHLAAAPDPDYSLVGGLADVPACLATAGAMLRALPYVAALETLAQLEQPLASEDAPYRRGQLATALMLPTSGLASAVHHYCQGMEGAWSAADATAAAEALWQLHTTLCRGVHASPAGLNVVKPQIEALLISLVHCFKAALGLEAALQARAASSDADVPVSKPRHLLAMSVAQAEAAFVAAACQPRPADDVLASTLIQAVNSGPSALASSPSVQQALDGLRVEAGKASRNADSHRALLADLQHHQQLRREPQADDALELAQAAAVRSCAYLRCANLAGEGGPAAGQGQGSQRCSKCRVAWYCGTACSHADWRAGHRRVCRALGPARVAVPEGGGEEV